MTFDHASNTIFVNSKDPWEKLGVLLSEDVVDLEKHVSVFMPGDGYMEQCIGTFRVKDETRGRSRHWTPEAMVNWCSVL